MIVVKLMGGLGNQMFQYAAGRALSVKHGVPLWLDETYLTSDPEGAHTLRLPELHQLKINAGIANKDLLSQFKDNSFWKKLLKTSANVLSEGSALNRDFFKTGPTVYLSGFWQSEDYFVSCRDLLLKEFSPQYEPDETFEYYLKKISACNSVSIHVRRGDYVSHAGANRFHGVLAENYYREAMVLINQKTDAGHFFVFSDDLEWCRNTFKDLGNVSFVESNSKFSFTDMFLMKHCRHHIIANSSYSWWGSWLCENAGNITIAPRTWLLDHSLSTDKIYCKDWIKI